MSGLGRWRPGRKARTVGCLRLCAGGRKTGDSPTRRPRRECHENHYEHVHAKDCLASPSPDGGRRPPRRHIWWTVRIDLRRIRSFIPWRILEARHDGRLFCSVRRRRRCLGRRLPRDLSLSRTYVGTYRSFSRGGRRRTNVGRGRSSADGPEPAATSAKSGGAVDLGSAANAASHHEASAVLLNRFRLVHSAFSIGQVAISGQSISARSRPEYRTVQADLRFCDRHGTPRCIFKGMTAGKKVPEDRS